LQPKRSDVKKVVILTKGTAGDLFPFLAAASALRGRGHSVVFLSHCDYQAEVEKTGAAFVPLDSSKERALFLQDVSLLNTPTGALRFFTQHCLPRTCREYQLLAEQCSKGEPSVLLTRHLSSVADLFIAEEQGKPLIRLFTAVSQVTTFDLLNQLVMALLESKLRALRAELGLRPKCDWNEFLAIPVLNVGNWPSWFLDAGESFPISVNALGFLVHDPAESGEIPCDVKSFLGEDRDAVLVTGGTGDVVDEKFYSSAIEACRSCGLRALVVSRYWRPSQGMAGDSVKWVASLPFAAVVPQVSVVIHHGGSGTIARALLSGTPQLALAHGADRPDNATRLARLGLADYLRPSEWQPRRIVMSLDRLRTSRELHERCRSFSQRVQREHAAERLCDVVQSLAAA
jgi:rhamnosyltransferase subunit B